MDGRNIVGLLERIATGVEKTNERLDRLEQGQARLERGQAQTNERLGRVEGRLDNMLDFMGRRHADHERRIEALEEHVFKKSD